jgi:hypothetical protein
VSVCFTTKHETVFDQLALREQSVLNELRGIADLLNPKPPALPLCHQKLRVLPLHPCVGPIGFSRNNKTALTMAKQWAPKCRGTEMLTFAALK